MQVQNVIDMPANDSLSLLDASRFDILMRCCALMSSACRYEYTWLRRKLRLKCLASLASSVRLQAVQSGHRGPSTAGHLLRLPRQPAAAGDLRGGQGEAEDCHPVLLGLMRRKSTAKLNKELNMDFRLCCTEPLCWRALL